MKQVKKIKNYKVEYVEDNPKADKIKNGIIYIVRIKVGRKTFLKWAFFKCPDGCGDVLMLSLADNDRAFWKFRLDYLKRPFLSPSINKTDGCKSHFWIKKGKVEWARFDSY